VHAAQYSHLLSEVDVRLPTVPEGLTPIFHQYVIRTSKRDALLAYLKEQGVGAGIHYPTPLHRQRAFIKLGLEPVYLPETEECANEILSLPMYPELTDDQIEYVADQIKKFFAA
jgi:dTDP-4-amino-4,6-dideoxygalactose transaminase